MIHSCLEVSEYDNDDGEDPDANSSETNSVQRRKARKLSTELVNAGILRGTTTETLLSWGGARLRATSGGLGNVASAADDEFGRSFEVNQLDVFLSHSWHANWLLKYMTLLFHFNGVPALICGASAGLAAFALQWNGFGFADHDRGGSVGFSTPRLICFGVGTLAYLLCLFNWHQLVAKLPFGCGGKSLFLDKVCIHQTDQKRKEEGIMSIGGILANSQTMLVAWDKTYFSRLWCTFEMSVFVNAMPDACVDLIPVFYGGLLAAWLIGDAIAEVTLVVVVLICDASNMPLNVMQNFYLLCWWVTTLFCAKIMRECARDVKDLDFQLSNFRVQDVQCFCCSCDHKHPETGDKLACDRVMVYNFLDDFYDGRAHEDALQDFNSMVHTSFRSQVRRSLGGILHVNYYITLTVGVWSAIASLDWSLASTAPLWYSIHRFIFWSVFAFPIALGSIMALVRFSPLFPATWLGKRLMEVSIATIFIALLQAFTVVDRKLGPRGDKLTIIWVSFESVLVYVLYFMKCSWHQNRPKAGASGEK